LSRVKRGLAAVFVSAAMLVMMAAPAMAHIHVTIPADECAVSDQAANNQTARSAILEHNDAQSLPVGNVTNAPTSCPAP
jgi:hypothetical protein